MKTVAGSEMSQVSGNYHEHKQRVDTRELKQATFLSTRTSAGSKSRRYRWQMMASAVLV